MTAIDKYIRLEALGQWRETPDTPPREVVVSFGNATLLLSDMDESPMCHWAMAATSRLSLDGSKAVYTPDTEGFETLEIDDAEMVEAIAQVSRTAVTLKRRTPRLRLVFTGCLMVIVGAIFYVAPSVLRGQAVRMTGPESARKLGTDMVAILDTDICRDPRADTVRAQFQSRVFPDGRTLLLIARNRSHASAFPGGVVVIGDDILGAMQTPSELAGLATTLFAQSEIKLAQLFEASSPRELFKYITSGTLSEDLLEKAARNFADGPKIVEAAKFASPGQPLLRDQDWVTLQGICLQ